MAASSADSRAQLDGKRVSAPEVLQGGDAREEAETNVRITLRVTSAPRVVSLPDLRGDAPMTVTLGGRGAENKAAVSERSNEPNFDGVLAPGGSSQLRSETCRSARRGLAFYTARVRMWRDKMGAGTGVGREGRLDDSGSCPRYLAHLWQRKARAARRAWERYRTLRDFPIRPGNNAWLRAVEEVQRPYPGSRSWLRSCSAAEGGWGRWVIHGGAPYYPGVEYRDTSSGHLQYRYSTFRGHYRRALDDLRSRGFKVPKHLRAVSVKAWRSALGQALAGGWARWSGNDGSHWSASWSRGCR